ncbi:MAG: RecQ family ATP-dependent DNA helicase [Puniceicoccaceae bacterium]
MADKSVNSFCLEGVFIDLETTLDGKIREVGYCYGDERQIGKSTKERKQVFSRLGEIAGQARFVGGHNILWHDLPVIADTKSCPNLLELPVLDTLLLSPLAFPQKPYHRLIKNDKLVTASKSNPLNDAEASRQIAEDALQALGDYQLADWSILQALLSSGNLPGQVKAGLGLISNLLEADVVDPIEALRLFKERYPERFCHAGLSRLVSDTTDPPMWISLAYVSAWIRVAGTDSIVPPWVKRQFPGVYDVMHELRSVPCGDASCTYCSETHDPVRQLKKFFNYDSFRPEPSLPTDPARSLQEEIVRQTIGGRPIMAILPTGGGKSLCFQLPALQRYYRDGSLTVVISPLQALMKDQVDGLAKKTGVRCIGALYGLLTPPERGELLEELSLGGIGIIYVSPEQLRNPSFRSAIASRDIAYWVCDEVHCISKWGHDFRPDYLYIARFIRELAEFTHIEEIAPVVCLTATAKEDVKDEISQHFRDQLGQDLLVLDGGAERTNLAYRVEPVESTQKAVRIHEILKDRLEGINGAAVVFVATRKHAEQTALILQGLKWKAEFFHAGLDPDEKKDILDRFIANEIQVICATNAFGMGIDKEDIRLVIHADVPGSLENYLQEAGRAGRDRKPAECVLLYSAKDLERQFSMGAFSRIYESDIRKILSALRTAERRSGRDDSISVSTREILLGCRGGTTIEDDPEGLIDTKVKTAISVLEEGAFLARNDNLTRVFQGRPLVEDLDEVENYIKQADLPANIAELWRQFMRVFINLPEDAPDAVERFAEVPAMARIYEIEKEKHGRFWNRYRPIFGTLNDMADAGLIKKDLLISAIVKVDIAASSDLTRKRWIHVENQMLNALREKDPNPEGAVPLSLKRLNTSLSNQLGEKTLVEEIPKIMELWKRDRPRIDGGASAFISKKHGTGYLVELPDGWDPIVNSVDLRQNAGALLLEYILRLAREQFGKGRHEIEFSESELLDLLKEDIMFAGSTSRSLSDIIRFVLVSLHDQGVIVLKKGKALFTQSMQITLKKDADGKYTKRFGKAHFDRLEIYYQEKNFQIHVMAEYAKLGMDSLTAHLKLISDYFELGNAEFANRYFAGRSKELELATGMESYLQIVESLGNKDQQAIVAAPERQNMLVLAGPGSGKTRVVSHRCAYLLRVRRVRPRSILVVCFNRHACLTLRRRIYQLVGDDARGVTIQTYHGLALSLLGRTFADEGAKSPPETIDFDSLITDATEYLRSPSDDTEEQEDTLRSRVLRGYQHILVDEYQDISQREYDFLSEIAGRTLNDSDQKLSILSVGDDDQSIYGFRDANITFIQKFKEDYQAEIHYLVQNYRSTSNIIHSANQLIRLNKDRMKTDHEIRVNEGRKSHPPGGDYEKLDAFRKGRVQVIESNEPLYDAALVLREMQKIRELNPDTTWNQFAILSRNKADLNPMRAVLEAADIPVDWRADTESLPSPFRIREIHQWLLRLQAADSETWTPENLTNLLTEHTEKYGNNEWCQLLYQISEEWKADCGDGDFPVRFLRDFYTEALQEHKREKHNHTGVILTNAHRAKGLEFPHVFILSPHWMTIGTITEVEEERRLYYVAMTRAEQTLTLFKSPQLVKWLECLHGSAILQRTWEPPPNHRERVDSICDLRYDIIGLDEIFISFAGLRDAQARIHKELSAISTGTPLFLHRNGEKIEIRTANRVAVASLSAKGGTKWADRLDHIQSVFTKAIVRRYKEDSEIPSGMTVRCDSWEIPIVEVVWREKTEPAAMVAEEAGPYGVQ